MFKSILSVLKLLEPAEKKKLNILLLFTFFNALLQTISVISVLPFIAIVARPQMLTENKYLFSLYDFMGFTHPNNFLIVFGIAVLCLIIISNLSFANTLYRQKQFTRHFHVSLSSKLISAYIGQPYEFFLQKNSAELSKHVLEDARFIAEKMMISILDLFIAAIICTILIVLIVLVDPLLSMFVVLFIGSFYGAIYIFTRNKIQKLSYIKSDALKARHKLMHETFGAIKDIKLSGNESIFLKIFREKDSIFAEAISKIAMFTRFPGLLLDVITFGGLMLIVIYLLVKQGDISRSVPILALYALSAQRLKPQIQVMFTSLANINFSKASLEIVIHDLKEFGIPNNSNDIHSEDPDISFNTINEIEINSLNFHYPKRNHNVITNLNLKIPGNKTIAFVGHSGSGKTTLVDIILGILSPQDGNIKVNGMELSNKNKSVWQRSIGYIPQHIFLFDDTIARNIAFGIQEENIDITRLNEVIQMAELVEFIANQPEGIHTKVGDRGIRLSGGQRQRIGIARALYHRPSLLVMDEATSALDGITEDSVMESIYKLSGSLTIIIIAHRLSTIKNCNIIHFMRAGKILQTGTYSELLASNEEFRMMAKKINIPKEPVL